MDDGISGTNTKKREEFNRMIEECMAGHIDMIITKSISRFARNTLDCLKYIRLLKEKNIPVFFEKENINTMDSKGEVLLTIPQYYVENNHEPIIPRDLYMQVQEEMLRRANMHSGEKMKKRVYSSKYALSSIVYCSKCGDIYRRIAWNNRGKHSIVWRCVNRVEHGPDCCNARTVKEEELQNAVVKAINQSIGDRDEMFDILEENIKMVFALEDESSLESINARLEETQRELLKRANAKQNYNDLADEIDHLREMKQAALTENAEREGLKQRIAEMKQFLTEQMEQIEKYDEFLVRRMIGKVIVYEDRLAVEFKSGTNIDICL